MSDTQAEGHQADGHRPDGLPPIFADEAAPAAAAGEPARRPHVVIVGGGFGGLRAARRLRRAPVRVTLLDRSNFHLFQPLLYQVATAALSPADIAYPIRSIFHGDGNIRVLMAEVTDLDLAQRRVLLRDDRPMAYDYLILACGATHTYFGHDEWEAYAPGLKTIPDAIEIRSRFLAAFEHAERETDPQKQEELLTFAIVGGGPTGVELAGALVEIARNLLPRDYRNVSGKRTRVVLIEGGPHVLGAYPEALAKRAREHLEELGVEVHTGQPVTAIDAESIRFGDQTIRTRNVIWAAGVAASPLGRKLGAPVDRAGRVKVEPDLSVPGHPEILVIGDQVALKDAKGQVVPGVAPAAMQMGTYAGEVIEHRVAGTTPRPFAYHDKGSLAVIGRGAAVAWFKRTQMDGFLAWMAWLLVHIYYLIGFRNRILVLLQWAWAYLDYWRGARLITVYGVPESVGERPRSVQTEESTTSVSGAASQAG